MSSKTETDIVDQTNLSSFVEEHCTKIQMALLHEIALIVHLSKVLTWGDNNFGSCFVFWSCLNHV